MTTLENKQTTAGSSVGAPSKVSQGGLKRRLLSTGQGSAVGTTTADSNDSMVWMNGWLRPALRAQREKWHTEMAAQIPADNRTWTETYLAAISHSYML
eukprot:4391752-Pyramimonas_sp.AAC.1